jgi:hypothetical protein
MAATNLILGFWLDVLTGRLRPKFAFRTKVLCMVGAGFCLLCIPGLILSLRFQITTVGAILVYIPIGGNILLQIIFLIVISCQKLKSPQESSAAKKKKYTTKVMGFIITSWLVHLINIAILGAAIREPAGKGTWIAVIDNSIDVFAFFTMAFVL